MSRSKKPEEKKPEPEPRRGREGCLAVDAETPAPTEASVWSPAGPAPTPDEVKEPEVQTSAQDGDGLPPPSVEILRIVYDDARACYLIQDSFGANVVPTGFASTEEAETYLAESAGDTPYMIGLPLDKRECLKLFGGRGLNEDGSEKAWYTSLLGHPWHDEVPLDLLMEAVEEFEEEGWSYVIPQSWGAALDAYHLGNIQFASQLKPAQEPEPEPEPTADVPEPEEPEVPATSGPVCKFFRPHFRVSCGSRHIGGRCIYHDARELQHKCPRFATGR